MDETSAVLSQEQRLGELLLHFRDSDSEQLLADVTTTAQNLANALRVRDGPVDNHSALGETNLPANLSSLLGLALNGAPTPKDSHASTVYELLRVSANVCMDHDENRGRLLQAGVLQCIVSILEGYASIPPPTDPSIMSMSILHLKVARTAIGALLNASLGYEPVKNHLRSLQVEVTLMKLAESLYPLTYWINNAPFPEEEAEEQWLLRSGLSNWSWRILSELKDENSSFSTDVLPLLSSPLVAFTSPYPAMQPKLPPDSSLFTALLQADYDVLEEACTLIESLALDVEDVRLALARGMGFPAEHGGIRCLSTMLDFVERGEYHPMWKHLGDGESKRLEKSFDIFKAAVIKSIVEVAGEDKNEEVLWDDSEQDEPGGEFVCRMVGWVKSYVRDIGEIKKVERDDLAICATLSLGNLSRREKHGITILSPPHALASPLVTLLVPSTDIKLKHGVLGLLKNLVQSSSPTSVIHTSLNEAKVVLRICECGIWDDKSDAMADVVQLSAIGVVKHMCNNVDSCLSLVLQQQGSSRTTGLKQILSLVKRTDSVPLRSEGVRVLVNIVKSLWSTTAGSTMVSPTADFGDPSTQSESQRRRAEGMRAVLTPECASALTLLVGRSGKYPLLINEGLIAMSLISTQNAGASLVVRALIVPIPPDASEPISAAGSTSSDASSPVVATPTSSVRGKIPLPRSPLDMILSVIRNVDNPANYAIETRINACSLLTQLMKNSPPEDFSLIKDTSRPVIQGVYDESRTSQGMGEVFSKALKKLLDGMSS